MKIVENGLIPIYQGEDFERLVDGRELHEFLGNKRQFADWIKQRIDECELAENIDYVRISQNCETSTGGTRRIDYALTLDAAKHFAMLERNTQGKKIRQYFIEVEKKAGSILANTISRKQLAQMVIEAEERAELLEMTNKLLETENKALIPKAQVYDQFIAAKNAVNIGTFAKMIQRGPNRLFDLLRQMGILFKRGDANLPKQEYIERGYFTVKLSPVVIHGQVVNKTVTLLTPKGQEWLYKKITTETVAAS